jgi:hypothetical protein
VLVDIDHRPVSRHGRPPISSQATRGARRAHLAIPLTGSLNRLSEAVQMARVNDRGQESDWMLVVIR